MIPAATPRASTAERVGETAGRPPVLFLGLPMAISVRDVLRTGVVRRLVDTGVTVHLFLPAGGTPALREEFGGPGVHFHPLARPDSALFDLLDAALLKVHTLVLSVRCETGSIMTAETVRRSLPSRVARALVARSRRLQDLLIGATRWAYRVAGPELYGEAFRTLGPDLVVGTRALTMTGPRAASADRYLDRHLLLSAARHRVPAMALVASWDNLTTSGFFPVAIDRMTVWNDVMRAQAAEIHGVDAARVDVTGAPQHDAYARGAFSAREEFLRAMGLDPARPVVVYATGTEGTVPDEPELLHRIAARLGADLPEVQLVARLHQLDSRARYAALEGMENVRIDLAGVSAPGPWADREFDRRELERLADTLRHADVVVNFASSITIDAAAVGTPVVLVDFDARPGVPYARSARRFYDFTHQRSLLECGGYARARSLDELVAAVRAYLSDPSRDAGARAHLVARLCHRVDGRSAERVAGAILDQLARGRARERVR